MSEHQEEPQIEPQEAAAPPALPGGPVPPADPPETELETAPCGAVEPLVPADAESEEAIDPDDEFDSDSDDQFDSDSDDQFDSDSDDEFDSDSDDQFDSDAENELDLEDDLDLDEDLDGETAGADEEGPEESEEPNAETPEEDVLEAVETVVEEEPVEPASVDDVVSEPEVAVVVEGDAEEVLPEASEQDAVEGEEDFDDAEPVMALGREETIQAIHALLFASDRPLNADRIAEALGDDIDRDVVVMLIGELKAQIAELPVPYLLREIAGGYQLTTRPDFGPFIRRLYAIKKSNRLSKSVLETLAIIAYKQPVTRPAVEAIRGVSVSHAFDILQEKRLIKVSGVAELPGRPKLYRTTDEFLMHFGIESLKELPSIEEIRDMG